MNTDVDQDNDDGKTAVDWAKESCEESPAALKETVRLYQKANLQAD